MTISIAEELKRVLRKIDIAAESPPWEHNESSLKELAKVLSDVTRRPHPSYNRFESERLARFLPVPVDVANPFNSPFLAPGSHGPLLVQNVEKIFTPEELFLLRSASQGPFFPGSSLDCLGGEKEKKVIIHLDDVVKTSSRPQKLVGTTTLMISPYKLLLEQSLFEKLAPFGFPNATSTKSKNPLGNNFGIYRQVNKDSVEIDLKSVMVSFHKPDFAYFTGVISGFTEVEGHAEINNALLNCSSDDKHKILRLVYRMLKEQKVTEDEECSWVLYSGKTISGVATGFMRDPSKPQED